LPCEVRFQALLNGRAVLANDDGPLASFNDGNSAGVAATGYFNFTTQTASGTPAIISVAGSTNTSIRMASRGTGNVSLATGSGTLFQVNDPGATVVNNLQLSGGLSNGSITLRAVGAPGDGLKSNISLYALLNGSVVLTNDDGPLASFADANTAGNAATGYFTFTTQSTSGTAPTISVSGSTNNSIKILAKGTGTALISGAGTGAVQLGISGDKISFLGATPVVKGTVTGSAGGNAALASLLTLLASYGLITDGST
jgi:hypothetical protein